MDKKGITWVGNVYQRFEDMCLDVEEDTIKYVENQFQSVGESVRRFYSNVMQDFLPPPTSLESEKNPNGNEKNELSKDDSMNLTEQDSVKKENERVITRTVEDTSVISMLIQVRRDIDNSCRPSGEKIARTGLRSRKFNNDNYSLCSSVDTFVNKIHESSRDQSAEYYSKPESITESCDRDGNLSESKGEIRESSQGQTAKSTIESSNGAELCLNGKVSSIRGSSLNEQVQLDNYADEEIFMSQPNQSTKLFDWNLAIGTEAGEESSVKQSDRLELEETIVVVNEDDLQTLPQVECKKTTDNKTIRGSLYSRMRSGRKHEYRKLALHHGDSKNLDKKSDDLKKLPSRDFCESGWEIL